jgi:hypothetical protein
MGPVRRSGRRISMIALTMSNVWLRFVRPSSLHVLPLTETEIPYQAFARMRPVRQMPTICTHSLSTRDLIVTLSAFFKLTPTPRIAVEPRMALSPNLGDDAHLNNMA